MNKKLLICSVLFIALSFVSCVKENKYNGDGSTLIRIIGGGSPAAVTSNFIDFINTPQKLLVCDIRKDATDAADLSTTTTVIIKDDTAAIRAANPAYVFFPSAFYTIQSETAKVGGPGGTFTFTFKPGDFAKDINITIPDATVLDPSTTYAIAFTITTINGVGEISSSKSSVVTVAAKNKYDGVYSYVSGLVTRYTSPGVPAGDALSGPLGNTLPDVNFITTGASTVRIESLRWADGGGVGGVNPVYAAVNPATNLVTMSSGLNATLANWTGRENSYNPATKTYVLNFAWNPVTTTREYSVVFKYKKPR